jgi:hypothetical protein
MLTKREEYIKKAFFHSLPDDEATEMVKKISSIGEEIGFVGNNMSDNQEKFDKRKHKYDVWIAREVKKDEELIERVFDLRLIIDWAYEEKIDLPRHTFDEALELQRKWHEEMFRKYQIEQINIPDIDNNRIVFRFSDKKHFLYLLDESDLKYEGTVMGHCVGGTSYKTRVRNKKSIILSIRDEKNEPHVTIEINSELRRLVQKYGKSNQPPIEKYNKMYSEYLLFATDFPDLDNKELLSFLNLGFILDKE